MLPHVHRPSISRPVATLVAIMQNASCGVRTLMACQFRFRTSTVALVNMFIKFKHPSCVRWRGVCSLLKWEKWLPGPDLHQHEPPSKGGVLLVRPAGNEMVEKQEERSGLPKPSKMDAPSGLARYREQECTSKAHRFSICGVCYSL